MAYLQWLLMIAGAVLLVIGYRRNQRKLMAAAAVVLLLAGVADQLVGGIIDGIADAART